MSEPENTDHKRSRAPASSEESNQVCLNDTYVVNSPSVSLFVTSTPVATRSMPEEAEASSDSDLTSLAFNLLGKFMLL